MSTYFKRHLGAASCGADQMIRWGMNDRLSRLKPTPKNALPLRVDEWNLLHRVEEEKTRDCDYFVQIAPFATNCAVKEDSILDEIEKTRDEKIVRRNIRKRGATHRSNAKRRERRLALNTGRGKLPNMRWISNPPSYFAPERKLCGVLCLAISLQGRFRSGAEHKCNKLFQD